VSMRTPFATLEGKAAVVTGSARGIGRQIATTLLGVGMSVVLLDRDGDELAGTADELASLGQVTPIVADMNAAGSAAQVDSALRQLPQLAVWVNNAGGVSHQAAEEVDIAEFEATLRNNTSSALLGCQAAFRTMTGNGDRAIINISSGVVNKVLPQRLSYATSKAALETVTRYAAQEWGHRGIRVNAISPGYIETRLTQWPSDDPRQIAKQKTAESLALRRTGTVEDIAHAVLFLPSPLSAYVTGHVLFVDGGFHLA